MEEQKAVEGDAMDAIIAIMVVGSHKAVLALFIKTTVNATVTTYVTVTLVKAC